MALTTRIDPAVEGPAGRAFDEYLRASPYAAYQQSRAWASVVPREPRHDYLYAICRDQGRIVGAAVVRRTKLAAGHWLATMQRGPVVHHPLDMAKVLPALRDALAELGACSIQLAPRVRGRDLPIMAEALRASGFSPRPDDRQPIHRATGIVWLDKPEDAVLAGFRQRGRRQLKAAVKAGVTVRRVEGPGDIALYQAVLDDFRAARPDYDMGGLPDAVGQAALIEALGGAMLLAEHDGRTIGGHAFVRQGDEAIWLSLATSADYPELPRSYPLLWEGMKLARAMGCVGYDLAGMPVDEPADPAEAGRMQFKTAFAPHRRILLPMQIAALRPIPHLMLFGARELYHGLKRRRQAAA